MSVTPVNLVVRVKWAKGLVDVSDGVVSTRKRTIPFDATGVETIEGAITIGQAVLATHYDDLRSLTVRMKDLPDWVDVGDWVSAAGMAARVATQKVTVTDGGFADIAPTLGSASEDVLARQEVRLKRLSGSLNGGRSSGAGATIGKIDPKYPTGRVSPPGFDTWSWDPLDLTDGHTVEVADDVVLTKVMIQFSYGDPDAESGPRGQLTTLPHPVRFRPYVDEAVVSDAIWIVPAGTSRWSAIGLIPLRAKQLFSVIVDDVYDNTVADTDGVLCSVKFRTAPGSFIVDNTAQRRLD